MGKHKFPAPLKFNVGARVMGREWEGVAIIYSVRVGGVFSTDPTAIALSAENILNIELGGKGGSHRRCAQFARKCMYASVAMILPPAVRGQCLRWTCKFATYYNKTLTKFVQ